MSRPSKLTPQVEAIILESLRKGHTRTAAFEVAGVHRSKISVWLVRFATFRDAVMRAEAEAEVGAADTIHDAYKAGDWKAAGWWLERRRHEDWGKRDKLEIVATIRRLVREAGLGEDVEAEAVAEAESIFRTVRGGAGG